MKRYGLFFMVVLGAAMMARTEPADAADDGSRYDANDLSSITDANDVKPIDANDYVLTGVDDPNQAADANAVYVPTSAAETSVGNGISDPNGLISSYHQLDPNSITHAGDTSSDSNAAAPSSYDDSNIHSALDIINPIRALAGSGSATQALAQGPSAAPTVTSVTVTPVFPSTSDTIVVTFSGRKGANYVLDHVDVDVAGSVIMLNATWRRDGSADGPMVDYSQTQSLGKLNAGTYTLQVENYYGGQPCDGASKFITVTGPSTNTNSGGSLLDSLKSHFPSTDSGSLSNWHFIYLLN